MIFRTFYTQGLAIYSYLIADPKTGQALVIDPTRDINRYLEYARQENLRITDIAETHVHADFVSGASELKQALDGIPKIHCSALGGDHWVPGYADRKIQNGDIIEFSSLFFEAMHTPGHTPEHMMWLCHDRNGNPAVPRLAFTGDFLFVGSVGRPDLLGEREAGKLSKELYDSVFNRLAALPDSLEIYPAHGAGSLCGKALDARSMSTLGYERLNNPMLQKKPYEEWLASLYHDIPNVPPNFARIKKINLRGPSSLEPQTKSNPEVWIDVRNPEKFSQGHIKNSLNIPLGASFCNWAGSVLFEDRDLGIMADNKKDLSEARDNLKLIGFDQVCTARIWHKEELAKQFVIETLPMESVNGLLHWLKEASACVIDVRTQAEWNQGHILGALHIELATLAGQRQNVPQNQPLFVICGSGFRASVAASFLNKMGFSSVHNVQGGMHEWNFSGFPMVNE